MVPDGWKSTSIGACLIDATVRNSDERLTHDDLRSVNKNLGMIPMKDRVKGATVDRAKIVRKGWFAYNPMRINVGSICRWDANEECIVSPDYVVFECDEQKLCSDYFDQFRKSHRWNKFMEDAGRGSVRVRIYLDDLKQLKCVLPPIHEQKKIAEILTTWDVAIETAEKQLANSISQKNALMQQLLTGKMRLPGYDAVWGRQPYGEIAQFDSGFAFKSRDFSASGDLRVIRMSDLKEGELCDNEPCLVSADKVDGLERFRIFDGDFLFGMSGSLSNFAWVELAEETPLYLNQRVGRISSKGDNNQYFVQVLYLSEGVQKMISSLAAGAAQLNVSASHLRKILVGVPPADEQQAIVDVIDCSFTQLKKEQKYLTQLRSEKAALMQQLLTGKRRVNAEKEAAA